MNFLHEPLALHRARNGGLAPLAPWPARLALGFARRGAATRLVHRAHQGPLRVQRALHPEGAQVCHAIVLHPPGGIAGGDQLRIDVHVQAGAHALLTTPGAAKWYKSAGRQASQHVHLRLAAGSVAEWLPQETIVFDQALARSSLRVDLDEGATYCGWDIVCLGRRAAGEGFEQGCWRSDTQVFFKGGPLWIERGRVDGGSPWARSPLGLNGDTVWGTLALAGPEPRPADVERLRALRLPVGVRLAVTALPRVLLVRAIGPTAEPVRQALQACWGALREPVLGLPAQLPRIWST
jgi:urease accessory protein